MNRKRRIILAMMSGVALLGIGAAVSSMLPLLWISGASHWPHVPPPELFVTTQPEQEGIPGSYLLTQQTITADGLAVLGGRQCQLDLRPDGSFSIKNYPQWSSASSATPRATIISTTGHWRCETLNISYRGKDCWGVVFSDADTEIGPLALRSNGAPYDLMLTYGDSDAGQVMIFRKLEKPKENDEANK